MSAFKSVKIFAAVVLISTFASLCAAACNESSLNTTVTWYYVSEMETVASIANKTNRGLCDIGRENLMADVAINPNIGQNFTIPGEICDPDSMTCVLERWENPRECIFGGPRLYYSVNGDTWEYVALYRMNITVEALMEAAPDGASANDTIEAGQFVKVPESYPSQCVTQAYQFAKGVYKDLADMYGTTVGQIMMNSLTYNYSDSLAPWADKVTPSLSLPINCTLLASNYTILS